MQTAAAYLTLYEFTNTVPLQLKEDIDISILR
jgi:hypothetical protein